jgi:hypothetical protein
MFVRLMDSALNYDVSDVLFSADSASLLVKTKHIGPAKSADGRFDAMSIEMKAYGDDVTVNSIILDRLGSANSNIEVSISGSGISGLGTITGEEGSVSISGAEIKKESVKNAVVSVNVGANGKTVGLDVLGRESIVANAKDGVVVTLEKEKTEEGAYEVTLCGEVPSGIVIDGAFEDWLNIDSHANVERRGDVADSNGNLVSNANLDIVDYKGVNEATNVSFYLKVSGSIFGGASVPARFVQYQSSGEPSGGGELPVVEGYDYAYFLLDLDNNANTGYRAQMNVGIDRAIVIQGKDGAIISSKMYKYSGKAQCSIPKLLPLGEK